MAADDDDDNGELEQHDTECPVCGSGADQDKNGHWKCEEGCKLDGYQQCPDCSKLYHGTDPFCPDCLPEH